MPDSQAEVTISAPDQPAHVSERSLAVEHANGATHGLGLLLSIAASVVLWNAALEMGDPWRIASTAIYTTTLVGVYFFSTLSHVVHQPDWRHRFRVLDQGFIFLLIAGTFTPFGLVFLRRTPFFALVLLTWAVALWGFYSKLVLTRRIHGGSVMTCLVLGWLPALAIPPVIFTAPQPILIAIGWMLVGGLCYSIGTIFLWLDARWPWYHVLWHLLVIAGSAAHFWAIYRYVITLDLQSLPVGD